jgi:hypothetical protein
MARGTHTLLRSAHTTPLHQQIARKSARACPPVRHSVMPLHCSMRSMSAVAAPDNGLRRRPRCARLQKRAELQGGPTAYLPPPICLPSGPTAENSGCIGCCSCVGSSRHVPARVECTRACANRFSGCGEGVRACRVCGRDTCAVRCACVCVSAWRVHAPCMELQHPPRGCLTRAVNSEFAANRQALAHG